jgi:transcriptional regulator with XRE-family HTH domain
MNIALRIRKVRESKGYSQEYMAIKLGINQSSYCKLENNQRKISIEKIVRIAELLNIELVKLIDLRGID